MDVQRGDYEEPSISHWSDRACGRARRMLITKRWHRPWQWHPCRRGADSNCLKLPAAESHHPATDAFTRYAIAHSYNAIA
jgi:hypothetical protein